MTAILLLPLLLNADPQPTVEVHAKARQLVTKLGDLSFRVRENAARELKQLRYPAIPALMEGLTDVDSERVARCRTLLPSIEWWKNPTLLKFVLKPDSVPPKELPELGAFFRLTGDSQESRELYAEMITVHAPRLGSFVGDPDLMEQVFVNHRQQTLTTRGTHWDLRFEPNFFENRAGATLYFFLCSDPRYDHRYQLAKLDRTPLGNARLGDDLKTSPPLRKLYFDWVLRERSWFLKRTAMEMALRAKIEEALPVLPLLISSAQTPREVRDAAEMLLLANGYSSMQLRSHLQPLMSSSKVVENGIAISDVTLGVFLLSEGKLLAECGFRKSAKEELTLESFRFINPEGREQALKVWREMKR